MIKCKKIMTEVFPKFGGLPQPVIDKCLRKQMMGCCFTHRILNSWMAKSDSTAARNADLTEKRSQNIMCLKCNNKQVRVFCKKTYSNFYI